MFAAVIRTHETWLICGGRDFSNKEIFDAVMTDLLKLRGCPSVVVHGAARGADQMANEWAKRMALDVKAFPADWSAHGRGAGPIRNEQMLRHSRPQLVVAFPGGRGTAHMVKIARQAEIDVAEIQLAAKDG